MSFLAPLMLAAGALAALAAVAFHLLTTTRPPRAPLPTARFVPASEARAVSRASRPTDLLLLATRVLAALLLGAAFARPVPDAPGPAVRTVVLLDASAALADRAAALAAARRQLGEGGALVRFDSSARRLDTLAALPAGAPRVAPGALGAAFVAGVRAARDIARGADSVRMVVISPLEAEAFDAATLALRAEWPGPVGVVRVAGIADTAPAPRPELRTPLADDPLAPALAALPTARGTHAVRIVRARPTAADTAWAREDGHVLVHWPLAPASAAPAPDAVTVFGRVPATLVAPLVRVDEAMAAWDGAAGTVPPRAIARWRVGTPAATEQRLGGGCLRAIAFGIPPAGDLTLRPPFVALLAALVEPCGGARGVAVDEATVRALAGGAPPIPATPPATSVASPAPQVGGDAVAAADRVAAVPAPLLAAAGRADASLVRWLLAGALLALLAEWWLRRRPA